MSDTAKSAVSNLAQTRAQPMTPGGICYLYLYVVSSPWASASDLSTISSSLNQASIDKRSDHRLGRALGHGHQCGPFATIDKKQAGLN